MSRGLPAAGKRKRLLYCDKARPNLVEQQPQALRAVARAEYHIRMTSDDSGHGLKVMDDLIADMAQALGN